MNFRFFTVLMIVTLCLGLAGGAPTAVHAAEPDGNAVTLFQLGEGEIDLTGPYDSQTILFGLPSEWKLTGEAQFLLNMASSFNIYAGNTNAYGGALTVVLNGVTVGVVPISSTGEIAQTLTIPAQALVSKRADSRMELALLLDSGVDCDINQNLRVVVHSSSQFLFPHEVGQPDTSLVKFPAPLYQDTFRAESALIVLSDAPGAADLQSALTVSAGLGNLTNNQLAVDVTTFGQLSEAQKSASNLIFVGKAGSIAALSDLSLPIAYSGGKFAGGEEDGVVALVPSPWGASQVALVISGNSDAGTLKAAQAVSTGVLRPNAAPNLSVVAQVEPAAHPASIPTDQTLADLGYPRDIMNRLGVSTASYRFYLPPGQTVTSDAFFELVMGHSALVNYERSGLVISLNGQPIGSVRFTDATAASANNLINIPIPTTAVLTGNNRLDITAALYPVYNCSTPNFEDLYAVIWPTSRLHLPLQSVRGEMSGALSLDTYPAPFIFDPTLQSVNFILPDNDLTAWRSAVQLAGFLGDRAGGSLFVPRAFFASAVSDDDLASGNIILVGRPSQLPVAGTLNASLPVPFAEGSDLAQERNMQVIFNIPADVPVGYVEVLPSPWNAEYAVLAAFGNSAQGVTWSGAALVDANLRARLAGNFAAVTDQQVVTADTRLSVIAPAEADTVSPAAPAAPAAPVQRPAWILWTALAAGGLAVAILVAALLRNAAKNRRPARSE